MNTYFALTIGPIYKTLSQAQRTREFWGSSYMFSWIMREIICGMIADKTITNDEILMPHRDKHDNLHVGTGLYHDRMIAQINPEKKDRVLNDFKKIADAVFDEIVRNISPELKIDRAVLQSYFRLNAVLFDLEDGINIVETVTNYLDSLELQSPIFHEAYKIGWTSVIDDLNGSLFYKDAGVDFIFDSIPEIASRGLGSIEKDEYKNLVQKFIKDKFKPGSSKNEELKEQDVFIKELAKAFPKEFRSYHKYVAIVHADGDNFGKTITEIGNSPKDVKDLSTLLFNFASDAATEIDKYGGTNVYAGGDDLLFFAPVATTNDNGKQTIFDLINKLDSHFKTTVSDRLTKISETQRPTLSWGVSISYYKFPLSEAIVTSRKLLFDDAKSYEGKNAVAFKLTKHTGQFFGATFGKVGSDYNYFTTLLKDKFNTETDFISSLQYRISGNEALLRAIFKTTDYPTRIGNFFNNFFDEEIHSNKKDFVHSVRDMLIKAFSDTALPSNVDQEKAHETRVKTAIDKTYSALRFIHFLNSKSDE